ncbi:hypothetical protein [uncultured Methanobrevibacter sp.]|uniref:hypothetical protein n=1 Tax=uncultured Methanobrevibacter sp. TaxID=253161 RepID=UPI00263958B8|nr:hypothetical protein [uncultured Methanobrevibacter sp.]
MSVDDNSQIDNIKELIDNCEDNGVVNLEGKTYGLDASNETHIVLNKTVTIAGIDNETVIDGKNTSLFLDVNKSKTIIDDNSIIIGYWKDGYEFKYMGKNVTFKNITFKDLKMTTWHEMTFENCRFINSTFTSYEYPNTFKNCSFDESAIEMVLFFGYDKDLYHDHSKIMNCRFTNSTIGYKAEYTKNYIQIIGGDQFQITNSLDLINSSFSNSIISLYRNNITISNSNLSNSSLRSSSCIFNIANTDFNNPKIDVGYTTISISKSNLENPKIRLNGGYFSKGAELNLENTTINNCELETTVTFGSRIGSLKMNNSQISNSTFNLTYINVLLNNSQFDNSSFELFFSAADIIDSTFLNNETILNTIKTRNYKEVYISKDDEIFLPSLKECQVKTDYNVTNSYLINCSGKFEIKADDINMDTTHKITVNNESVYYFNDKLVINVKDHLGNPVIGLEIFIEDLDDYTYPTPSVKTNSEGIAEYRLNKVGNVKLKIYYKTEGMLYSDAEYGIDLNLTVKPTVTGIKVSKVNFNANVYSNIKGYLKIEAIANSSADLKNLKFSYKVYTNGKAKTYYTKTDSKGKTTFKLPKALTAGTHKIEIKLVNTNIKKTVKVKIAKAKTTLKAPKVTSKFKRSKYFKVSVKNKATKKAVSNVKVKIKVYTGKKYKTYNVKTNKKGMAKINTKKLKVGKHKVAISSANSNYQIKASSLITIR